MRSCRADIGAVSRPHGQSQSGGARLPHRNKESQTWTTSSSSPPPARRSAASTAPWARCPRTRSAPSRCRPRSSAPASTPADVDEVILGQVLAAGEGQNPARQAARAAGLPDAKTAFGINQVCGSGLRAVALAAQQIRTGESAIVAAGGMESMSLSQHAAYLRAGTEDGRRRVHRHDAEGRAVGRVPRLPHGQHGGERRHQVPDHPRAAGRSSRSARSRRRARRRRPAASRTRSRR